MSNSTQKLGIEITTDLKQSVESFRRLQTALLEQKRALVEAKAATAGAAVAWKEAQAKADGLRVQVALGKTELERQAAATGKSSVEYRALQQAVTALAASLKQADGVARATSAEFERQRRATQQLAAEGARLAAQRERDRRALQAEGVDVKQLGQTYQRLEQQRAAAQRVTDARATLGVRGHADIAAEIARARQAYADLKTSGLATFAELAQAKARLGARVRELQAQTNGWAQSLDQVKLRLLGLGAALAGAGRFSFQGGGELAAFEKQIALVATTTDRMPRQLAPLGAEIRALSQDLGVSAQGAAAAAYQISGSGTALENVLPVLRQAIQASIAGNTDVKTAADAGLNAMNAYGYGVEHLGRIYDVLFRAVADGKMEFGDMARQLGDILPIARGAGVSLEEVGAALARMTLKGQSAPIAVTALKTAVLALASPTAEAKKQAEAYGITWTGLVGTLQQIADKKLGLQEIMAVLGDRDAANAVLSITQDFGKFREQLDRSRNSAGAFLEAFGKMDGIDEAKIRRFNAAWEDFKMVAGGAVLAATPLLESLTALLRAFNALPGPVQALSGAITVLGGGWLVFGRAIGAVTEAATLLWAAFRAGAAPVAAAQGAITGATGAAAGFSARLLAIQGPLGMVAAALASAGAAWLLFGRQADQGGRQAETAIERLRQAQAGLAAAAAQTPAALAQAAEAEIAALETRRAAVAAQLQAARARAQQPRPADVPSAGDPVAEVIGLVSELANLERQIAAGRAVVARQRAMDAPLPTPTPASPAPGASERGGDRASRYDPQFSAAEAQYRLPPGLLKAVADVESGFNPRAISPTGAKGLMQFMPGTASRFGLNDPFNAEASIQAAGKYFRTLLDLFKGDLVKAIAAYNAGEGNVQKLGIDKVLSPGFAKGQTRAYVPKVLGKLEAYGNNVGLQDQFEREREAAQERERLAEETTRFETTQKEASVEAAARADALTTARLEAAYQNRELSAREYYAQLDQLQKAATDRETAELNRQVTVERAAQATRTQGTLEYVQGQEAIFALEQKIAETRDRAAQTAQANQIALAAATREQNQALAEQLHQVKVKLLELQTDGPKLADIVIPPEQRELFQARLQVLQDQYREFMGRLRQAGDTAGLAQVRELITAEAVRAASDKFNQVTEFGIQAARNIQTAFADFLFDPFKDGLKGMARSFLETLRRMAANAAAASIMRGVLGPNFEKGELGGWLGGIIGAVRGDRQATPYPKGSVPDGAQVGPPAPSTVGKAAGAAVAVDPATFEGVLGSFKTGFEQIFNGDFFKGLSSIFEGGFGGIVSLLGDLIGSLFSGGSGGSSTASAVAEGVGTALEVIGSFFHAGGLVGANGVTRALPALAFAGAPRYHAGGLAGLKPNEVPAVLMGGPKGQREEVLTANDPRHRDNLGRAGAPGAPGRPGQPAAASEPTVNVVNVMDPSLLGQFLSTKGGERLVMNVLSRNSGALQKLVSRG